MSTGRKSRAWKAAPYIRKLLDTRERWVTVISLTAIALSFNLAVEKKVDIGRLPIWIGLAASIYIAVVNCYYKGAEAEGAKTGWRSLLLIYKIGPLGLLQVAIPVVCGVIAVAHLPTTISAPATSEPATQTTKGTP